MPDPNALPLSADLRRIRPPADYFGETRTSRNFGLRDILCFTRRSRMEAAAEPLSRHHHHRHVLVVPREGSGTAYADDRRFSLRPGDALLIFPFQFHHGFSFDRPRVLWLFITFEAGPGGALDGLRMRPLRGLKPRDFSLLAGFAHAWLAKDAGDELAPWLGLFLSRMLRSAPRGSESTPSWSCRAPSESISFPAVKWCVTISPTNGPRILSGRHCRWRRSSR